MHCCLKGILTGWEDRVHTHGTGSTYMGLRARAGKSRGDGLRVCRGRRGEPVTVTVVSHSMVMCSHPYTPINTHTHHCTKGIYPQVRLTCTLYARGRPGIHNPHTHTHYIHQAYTSHCVHPLSARSLSLSRSLSLFTTKLKINF